MEISFHYKGFSLNETGPCKEKAPVSQIRHSMFSCFVTTLIDEIKSITIYYFFKF